ATSRRHLLQRIIKKVNNEKNYMMLYNIMVPEVHCPVKVRVGSLSDGGKIPKGSVVFSLGMSNEISFELELQSITNTCCFIFGFDGKEQSSATQHRLSQLRAKSRKAKISGTTEENNNKYTIDYLMKLENVTHVEILKADIEGAEMDALPGFLEKHHPAQDTCYYVVQHALSHSSTMHQITVAAY
ncbi:hypothetical protein ANCDUO_05574, partial [Ancylostoma duodenale]